MRCYVSTSQKKMFRVLKKKLGNLPKSDTEKNGTWKAGALWKANF